MLVNVHVNLGVYFTQLREQPSSVTVDMFYRGHVWQEYESFSLIAWKEGLLWRALWKVSITAKHSSFFDWLIYLFIFFGLQHGCFALSNKFQWVQWNLHMFISKDSITLLWAWEMPTVLSVYTACANVRAYGTVLTVTCTQRCLNLNMFWKCSKGGIKPQSKKNINIILL